MHILFITKAYSPTYNLDANVFFKEQAIAIHKQGVQVGAVAVNFISWKIIIKKLFFDFGLKHRRLNGINSYVYQTPVIPFIRKINYFRRKYILKKLSQMYFKQYGLPDICHIHTFYPGEEGIRIYNKYKIPYIITEHFSVFRNDLLKDFEKKIAAKVFENASFRISVGKEFCELLEKEYKLPFYYIPNLVDINKFNYNVNKTQSNTTRFITVGNLVSGKNIELQLKALAKLNHDFHLSVIGSGPLLSTFKKMCVSLNIADKVSFEGFVPNSKLPEYLNNSDIFVFTSKYETFGIVTIEAMSCGLPVISTPVGLTQEILKDENLGCLTSFDENDLKNKMEYCINNEFDKNYIRNFVAENYSAEVIANNILDVYKSVLNSKNLDYDSIS